MIYKDIASEQAKEKATINQVYTCIDDVKKVFRFKNLNDFTEIKDLNNKLEIINTRLNKIENAIEKLANIVIKE